jgi:Gylcosyl hydrolase family 115 C-terminal domain
VLYPVKASAQVVELYITVGRNHLYASRGRSSTNDLAAKARALFQADSDLSGEYNHTLAHGKWNHMMDQPRIGYTGWHDPPANVMPEVKEIEVPLAPGLGVAVEGSLSAWPENARQPELSLPVSDVFNQQRRYIDIFNRGRTPFTFTASVSQPWIVLSAARGTLGSDQRLWVSVDWRKAPKGSGSGTVKLAGAGTDSVAVKVRIFNPELPTKTSLQGFVEGDGYVSIEAAHYTHKTDTASARWDEIADYGRTLSSMTLFPVTAASVTPPDAPCLQYQMYLFSPGTVQVETILAPTLNFVPGRGLRYAIAFDDQPPQTVDILANNSQADWETSVKDSVRKIQSTHTLATSGDHVLKIWMVDPGVVLQKIVVNTGGLKPSYLGPPESYHRETRQ